MTFSEGVCGKKSYNIQSFFILRLSEESEELYSVEFSLVGDPVDSVFLYSRSFSFSDLQALLIKLS